MNMLDEVTEWEDELRCYILEVLEMFDEKISEARKSENSPRNVRLAYEQAMIDIESMVKCNNCREVQEIYAGMETFIPETAPEGYCLHIIRQMYKATLELKETKTSEFQSKPE